jgi:REP element-mobilizing transposase RayT
MPQSLAQIYLHLVFSTKGRRSWLQDQTIRAEMHKYLAKICNEKDCPALEIGGVADHVHVLCRFGRTISVAGLIKELKYESSKWAKERTANLAEFYWQNGYGAFSVSPSHVEPLREYILNQQEHHRTESFD